MLLFTLYVLSNFLSSFLPFSNIIKIRSFLLAHTVSQINPNSIVIWVGYLLFDILVFDDCLSIFFAVLFGKYFIKLSLHMLLFVLDSGVELIFNVFNSFKLLFDILHIVNI